MSHEERQLLDEALIRTYNAKGITHDNASLDDPANPGQYRETPVLGDLHEILKDAPETTHMAHILNRLVHGSASTFNKQTNVRLDNKYTVLDISSLTEAADLLRIVTMYALYAMDTTDIQRYPDNYEILSTDTALRAERIACRLRHLIYSSTSIRKGDYLQSASVAQGISITYENEVLEVTLPGLLPKRRQRQSSEFLLDPLYFALEQYAKERPLPHYRNCVVCFAQVYDQTLPTRRVHDYDNLEEKQLLDLLSTFVMADDTGLLCDAYNTTELGEQDCTKIFVMEKKRFPQWLAERKESLKTISDF